VPILELWIIIEVGGLIGVWPTLALLLSLSTSAPRSAAVSDRGGWFSGRRRADS
jgi:UPF0716 family protein affecting phage T7 exclusion